MRASQEIPIFCSFSLGSHKVNEWSQPRLSFAFLPEALCPEKGTVLQGCVSPFYTCSLSSSQHLHSCYPHLAEWKLRQLTATALVCVRPGLDPRLPEPRRVEEEPQISAGKIKHGQNHMQAQEEEWALVGDNLDGEFKTTSKCLKERAEASSPKGWVAF